MIYLNNAATSYPKPSCVTEAVQACLMGTPASQFRGGAALTGKDPETLCRERLGKLLNIRHTERIFFTSGATESLNMVFAGLLDPGEILVTQTEHNSVLRPLMNRRDKEKFPVKVIPCEQDGEVTLKALEETVTENSRVLVVNHCSNVTGRVQDMEMMRDFSHRHHLFFIADASQSAGCLEVNADGWDADALIFTGHKSLLGPQGTGGFYIRPGYALIPLKYGGTGRNSAQLTYENGDYEYEVGTQNLPGTEGLSAGVDYILHTGLCRIMEKEAGLMNLLYQGLEKIPGVQLYGKRKDCRGPVMSMNIKGLSPSDAAYILWSSYGIIVRTGLHCAPLIHRAMGTEKAGTVRVSVSYFTTEDEIQSFLTAVREIAASVDNA